MDSFTKDNAFTGLEAGIVLIAFVVVASVFAYVILGAGFLTTQKSQEVIHTGVQAASSSVQLAGEVYGVGTAGAEIEMINFSTSLASGSTPVDFGKVTVTYSNATVLETLLPVPGLKSSSTTPGTWAITNAQNERGNPNTLLETGEQFIISVHPTDGSPKNTELYIEIKPSVGSPMVLKRSTPPAIDAVQKLY
jgi:flagellin FlaB